MTLIQQLQKAEITDHQSILLQFSATMKDEIKSFFYLEKILIALSNNKHNFNELDQYNLEEVEELTDDNKLLVLKLLTQDGTDTFRNLIIESSAQTSSKNGVELIDNNKPSVLQSLTQNETDIFKKPFPKISNQTPSQKLAAIFFTFSQSETVIELLSHTLNQFFINSSDLITKYEDLFHILNSLYFETDENINSILLNSLLITLGSEKLGTLINNNMAHFLDILSRINSTDINTILSRFPDSLLENLMSNFENIKQLTTLFFHELNDNLEMNPENGSSLCDLLVTLEQALPVGTISKHFARSENTNYISSLLSPSVNNDFLNYFNLTHNSFNLIDNSELENMMNPSAWRRDIDNFCNTFGEPTQIQNDDWELEQALKMSIEFFSTNSQNSITNKRKRIDDNLNVNQKKQKITNSNLSMFSRSASNKNKNFENTLLDSENVIRAIRIISDSEISFDFAGLIRELSRSNLNTSDFELQNKMEEKFTPYFVLIDYTLNKFCDLKEYAHLEGHITSRHNNAYNAYAIKFDHPKIDILRISQYFVEIILSLAQQPDNIKELIVNRDMSALDSLLESAPMASEAQPVNGMNGIK
ncbi:MAG: hypothetical protein HKM04_07535 [Legionellales bacterium]|nr:hypothetical protein [Legionellales bacterium]